MSTASPRPQLSLDELRRLKWLLGGVLALVSLWTVFFLDVEALGLVAVASGWILAAMVWPQLPSWIPAVLWRLAVPAIIFSVAADFYFSAETLPVLIRLAVLLVLYRAVAYRRKREDLQLIVLGMFLVVVGGVLTVSLEFAFLLLVFTACALGFLFVVTIIDMVDSGPKVMRPEEMREVPAWARGSWPKIFARLRRVMDWRMIALAGVLFAGVVGVSALLFMLIPRFEIGSSFFLDKYITRKSRTGFTETVRFGDVTELVRDQSVAMRVDLTDTASLSTLPYFRLIVLDEYTPQGFKMSVGLKSELLRAERVAQVLRGQRTAREAVGGQWTFYLEPGVSRFLPLPGSYTALRLRDPAPVQENRGNRLVALRSESMAMTAFQLEGVELATPVSDPALARVLREHRAGDLRAKDPGRYLLGNLHGPAGAENAAALARLVGEITGGASLDARAFAERATAWMQARHAYALSANIPRGETDDIVRWLQSNEPAFCEFFAGGLAVLSRAAGHPARLVAGFRGGALNAFENYIMVRNSDAHAWVEIFDGEGNWIRLDPTPGSEALGNTNAATVARQEQDSSWSARFDSLRVIWYRRVVNFDTRQQVELVDSVRSFATVTGDALRDRMEAMATRLKAWLAGPWDFGRLRRTVGALALVGALGWLMICVGRFAWQRWRGWRAPGEFDPVRREAGRWLRALGPSEAPRHPTAGVVGDLQRLRYGRRESWPEPAGVFKRARRARREATRGRTA